MIQLIRCTQKLQKEMGLKKSELFTEKTDNSRLGEWVANLIYIEIRKAFPKIIYAISIGINKVFGAVWRTSL